MILNYFHELNKLDETWELEEVFETHDELNQQLFDNDILRKDIRQRLLEIVDLFISKIKENNIPIDVIDYWLLGSNAAYNYGPKSDIDIHIIVNLEDLGVDPYILQVLYDYIKSDFNKKYDIMVKGHEVELYLEDVRSGAVTNGIYSLKQNRWIKFPTRTEYMRFDIIETDEYKDWYQRYLNLKDDEIEQFINDLYLMRKESLATEGEWGTGNLVFKEFRNLGYLDSLKDRKYKYRSKELTLENLEEDLLCENSWYEVSDIANPANPSFYYYAKDIASAQTHLLNMLNGKGTPHQSLDRGLLDTLRKRYSRLTAATFPTILSITAYPGLPPNNRLVKSDRMFRTDAQKHVASTTPPVTKYMVHHINKDEADNSLSNLVVIDAAQPDLAKCVHQILHSPVTAGTYTIDAYQYGPRGWYVSHTYTIII